MGINTAPIYDYDAWIDLAPEFDWDKLAPEAEPEEPVDPEPEDPTPGE